MNGGSMNTNRTKKGQDKGISKVGKKAIPRGSALSSGKDILNENNFQEAIFRGLSPANSIYFSKNIPAIKKAEKPRPPTPVTVVGFPTGFPKGLHIVGNKSPEPLKLTANFLNQELKEFRQDLIGVVEKGKVGQRQQKLPKAIMKVEPREATVRGKDWQNIGAKKSSSAGAKRMDALGDVDQIREDNRKSKFHSVPVAPWKEISSFQSPSEHRRQTFNNFKKMSPDPPKTPVETPSPRSTQKGNLRNGRRNEYQLHHQVNFINANVWTSREESYNNSANIASSLTNTAKRVGRFGGVRSITGLALAGRATNDPIPLKKAPSHTSNLTGRNKQITAISPASKLPPSNPSIIMTSGTVSTADILSSPKGAAGVLTNHHQNTQNQWNGILQTNTISVPVPPSKRLEQARHTNHILYGSYNGHDAASARVEAREKYAYPLYRYAANRQAPYHTNNIGGQMAKQQKSPQKSTLQPPVHVPGPKRENIYIGNYDGSDSDSDDDNNGSNSKTAS